jgi:hypothetical protein
MSQHLQTTTPLQRIAWPFVAVLAVVALVRPLLSITGLADDWGRPATPLLATLFVTIVWVVAIYLVVPDEPVLTAVLAGVAYAVLAIVLSGILSPIIDGELNGPLAHPVAILPMLVVNAAWGAFAGLVARALIDRRGLT